MVLAVVLLEIQVFWGVTPCRLVNVYQGLGLSDPKVEGTVILRNVSNCLPVDKAENPISL
jgi:hypothetical protein